MAGADGSPRAPDEATAPESWPLLQASCGRAQTFECMVCHCQIRQFGELPGDHFGGHFEGQDGASERQSELATASVS